jgi:hypothetical protein
MSAVNNLNEQNRSLDERYRINVAHRWRRDLKDVGDQALMRGLGTAFPIVRPGLSLSYNGRRPMAGHKAIDGNSPAVVPPPPVRNGGPRVNKFRRAEPPGQLPT